MIALSFKVCKSDIVDSIYFTTIPFLLCGWAFLLLNGYIESMDTLLVFTSLHDCGRKILTKFVGN